VTLNATDEGGSGLHAITYDVGVGPETVLGAAATVPIDAEGATTITYFGTDNAGNVEISKALTVRVDTHAPAITATRVPEPNTKGWSNRPVTVEFTCDDSRSGVGSCTSPITVAEEGENQQRTGSAQDIAGNTASLTVDGINIDLTAPVVTGYKIPPPNVNGWNNGDVSVLFDCSDALSGLTDCGPRLQVVTTEGFGQSRTAFAADAAGNAAAATVGLINIDRSPPTLACAAQPESLWPPNHQLVAVSTTVSIRDALSGSTGFVLASVTSTEPDDAPGGGDGHTPGDVRGWEEGTPDTRGQLRAERAGSGSGRNYTLRYRASDLAGNNGTCAVVVRVDHDHGR
jgi:hypothetical protein